MTTTMQSVRVGLFAVLGLVLTWIVFESLSGKTIFRDQGYFLVAEFHDLLELKVGDEVRMAGVRIGTVSDTRLEGRKAQAILLIRPEYDIPGGSTAVIALAGLLGSNYVAVRPGEEYARPLPRENGFIPTQATVDLNAVLGKFGALGERLEGFMGDLGQALGALSGEDQEGGLFGSLNRLIDTNMENLTETMSHLRTITEQISSGQGTLGRLLRDEEAYTEMVAAIQEIRRAATEAGSFVSEAGSLLAEVKSGKGLLGTLLFDETIGQELQVTAANLRQLSERINSGEGTLGRLLSDDTLYEEVQVLMRKAERALDGIGDQGPISAAGVAAGALF